MRARSAERGFTLAEALVVVGIIGIVGLIAGVQVSNFVNKANLEGTSAELRSFLDSAKSWTIKTNSPVTVRFQVVGDKSVLQMLATTGAPRATYTFPPYVKAAVSPGTAAPAVWPTPAPGALFTCDTMGRTIDPTTTRQASTTQTISITHRGMLDEPAFGSVRPRIRYDIQLYPLWNTSVAKSLY